MYGDIEDQMVEGPVFTVERIRLDEPTKRILFRLQTFPWWDSPDFSRTGQSLVAKDARLSASILSTKGGVPNLLASTHSADSI